MTKVTFSLKETVKQYMNGGNILIIATILALLCANLPGIREVYSAIWEMPVRLQIGDYNLFDHHGHPMTLLAFINDTLM
ncbi:MAG: Na+/H+ antiporter NhaA, partial [Bacteroidales bacterium]